MSHYIKALMNLAYNMDSYMVHALNFMHEIDDSFPQCKNMEEIKRKREQLPIIMFFSQTRANDTITAATAASPSSD